MEKVERERCREETEARSVEQRKNRNSSRNGMRKLRGGGSDSEPQMSPAAGPRQAYRKRDDTLRGRCHVVGVKSDRAFAASQRGGYNSRHVLSRICARVFRLRRLHAWVREVADLRDVSRRRNANPISRKGRKGRRQLNR